MSYTLPIVNGPGGGMNGNSQSQATTGTASSTNSPSVTNVSPGSLGWWLALFAGLVVVRVIYEVKGK